MTKLIDNKTRAGRLEHCGIYYRKDKAGNILHDEDGKPIEWCRVKGDTTHNGGAKIALNGEGLG